MKEYGIWMGELFNEPDCLDVRTFKSVQTGETIEIHEPVKLTMFERIVMGLSLGVGVGFGCWMAFLMLGILCR